MSGSGRVTGTPWPLVRRTGALFIYLFIVLATESLQAFSSCGEQGSTVCGRVHRLLIAVASLIVEHRLCAGSTAVGLSLVSPRHMETSQTGD